MAELSEEQVATLTQLVRDGQKIQAIKLCNEWTGMGLKDAKDFVDGLERQLEDGHPAWGEEPLPYRPMGTMSEDQAQRMTEAIFAGQKIEAIKLYREATGTGLKESKGFVDDLEKQLRQECPERFTSAARAGCGLVVLIGGVIGLIAGLG